MADTYEKNLTQKSTLTTSDYIRVVGSDNESYKQLVSDVAKKVIETYAGSSLAGSTQSVKDAIDGVNTKAASGKLIQTVYAITTTTTNISVPNSFRGYMWSIDSSTNGLGLYFVMSDASGNITVTAIQDATKLTHVETTNNLALTATSGNIRVLLVQVTI